jgi:hypothetical protein
MIAKFLLRATSARICVSRAAVCSSVLLPLLLAHPSLLLSGTAAKSSSCCSAGASPAAAASVAAAATLATQTPLIMPCTGACQPKAGCGLLVRAWRQLSRCRAFRRDSMRPTTVVTEFDGTAPTSSYVCKTTLQALCGLEGDNQIPQLSK